MNFTSADRNCAWISSALSINKHNEKDRVLKNTKAMPYNGNGLCIFFFIKINTIQTSEVLHPGPGYETDDIFTLQQTASS